LRTKNRTRNFYDCFRIKKEASSASFSGKSGAGEESRTLDLNLGKVALYQLSYSRMGTAFNDRAMYCNRNIINKKGSSESASLFKKSGAGEESRTLDLNLGKVALYQLSYSRVEQVRIIEKRLLLSSALLALTANARHFP
jgi:hypothetical protein